MNQIWEIIKWEFVNRVKTKLFLITTFGLPILLGGVLYLPSALLDLEPEISSNIGLVYDDEITTLVERFKKQTYSNYILQNGLPQFLFTRYKTEKEALDSVVNKDIDAYMYIPNEVIIDGTVTYYSQSLSNIKIYTNLRRTLNQLVIEQRMIDQNIDVSLVGALSKKIEFETFELDDSGQASKGNELSSFLVPYLFLMILFMTVFMSGQLLLRSVMEERTSRTIEILLCSVTPDDLMKGKILGLGALGLVQMIFYLILGLISMKYKG